MLVRAGGDLAAGPRIVSGAPQPHPCHLSGLLTATSCFIGCGDDVAARLDIELGTH
jgi:hypothetical protein